MKGDFEHILCPKLDKYNHINGSIHSIKQNGQAQFIEHQGFPSKDMKFKEELTNSGFTTYDSCLVLEAELSQTIVQNANKLNIEEQALILFR